MIADRHDISTKQSLQGEFYIFLIGGHYDNDRLTVMTVLQDKVYKEIFYIYQGGYYDNDRLTGMKLLQDKVQGDFYIYQGGYYDNDRLTGVTLCYKEIFLYLSRGLL